MKEILKGAKLVGRILLLAGIFMFAGVLFFEFAPPVMANEILRMVANVIGGITGLYVWAIGQLLMVVIQALLVIANFNNFVHAPPVVEGWKIVRDVCNMFFVLVLLVIAIGTILQQDKYHWTKLMPQFVSAAILINFSKVICGVLIDLAQVIMLTFVQAFSGAAGANFTVALGIPKILAASKNIQTFAGGISGGETNTFLSIAATYILAAIFVTVGLVVITIMTLILLMRIIALWFLVILSPFAFMFAVLPDTETYSKKWWTQFTNYIIVGPAMAFFLWLSLSIIQTQADGEKNAKNISAGSILYSSEKQGKDAAAKTDAGSLMDKGTGAQAGLAEIGSLDGMLSFLIGIGLMIGSLMAAQEMGVAGSNMAKGAISGMQDWAMGKKGPSPMRWARDRMTAYQKIGSERRELKARASASKLADTVAGVKKTAGSALKLPARILSTSPVGVAARTGLETMDKWWNDPGRSRPIKFLAGTGGHLTGGRHWQKKVDGDTKFFEDKSVIHKTNAAEHRKNALEARERGDLWEANKQEAKAELAVMGSDTYGMLAGLNSARKMSPVVAQQAGKMVLAGAAGGMLDTMIPGGLTVGPIAPTTLTGGSFSAAAFYAHNLGNQVYMNGEDQKISAHMAYAKLVNDQKKNIDDFSPDEKKVIANNQKPGVTPVERAAALQSLFEKNADSLSPEDKNRMPGLVDEIGALTNPLVKRALENHMYKSDVGQQKNPEALQKMLPKVDWKEHSVNISSESINRIIDGFQAMSHGPGSDTQSKAGVAASIGALAKGNKALLINIREVLKDRLTGAQAPGGGAVDPATGGFTQQHQNNISQYFDMGGKAGDIFTFNAPAAGGVTPGALEYLSQKINSNPNDAAKMLVNMSGEQIAVIGNDLSRNVTPELIGAINRQAKSDAQKTTKDTIFTGLSQGGAFTAANANPQAVHNAISRSTEQSQA